MPKSERCLLQVRITESQKCRIKSLAARHNMTIEKAVLEAFDAWAEKLRAPGAGRGPTKSPLPNSEASPSWSWLARAVQLDWSQCPEVELLQDGTNQLWLLRGTDAPVSEVLGALADGIPVPKIAEIFEIEPPQLAKIIQFAAPPG